MKTRILRKVNERVRIIEDNGMFVVQGRHSFKSKSDKWNDLNSFSTIERAVMKKNSYIVMIIMRDLGYRGEMIRRRTKRKRSK